MVKKDKKRELVVASVMITIFFLLSIRLSILQLYPTERVVSQYQNHQAETISNLKYMIYDTNGKDLMTYNKKYVVVIDKKPFSLNNYEETLEDLMAFNYIMKNEYPEFNYTDVMKSLGKLYYNVSEETYEKVTKLKNIKGLYYYTCDEVDNKKAWKVSSFLSKLPKEEELISGSLQEKIYNIVKNNSLAEMNFYLDGKAVYGKSEANVSEENRNLQLTLDLDMEDAIREVLAIDKYKNLDNVGVVVVESDSGKIRAMVQKDESAANVNLGIEGNGYEPGSIYKLITLGAALDNGVITMNDRFTCTGKVCGLGIHGNQTVEKALLNSCNDVFGIIGERVGYRDMLKYSKNLGLYSQVLNLSGNGQNEAKGIEPEFNSGLSNISIGQCMTTTPLQMVGAINAIVNGGEYIKPSLLEGVLDKDDKVVESFQYEKNRIFSTTTSKIIMDGMSKVVSSGTGKMAQVDGVEIGGKTGTADTSNPGYINCWFAGYFKSNNKYYTVVITVPNVKAKGEEGESLGGSNTCAPIFSDIVESLAK